MTAPSQQTESATRNSNYSKTASLSLTDANARRVPRVLHSVLIWPSVRNQVECLALDFYRNEGVEVA
jgi:hypothetical protein